MPIQLEQCPRSRPLADEGHREIARVQVGRLQFQLFIGRSIPASTLCCVRLDPEARSPRLRAQQPMRILMSYEAFAHCSRCGCQMARFTVDEKAGLLNACTACGKPLTEREWKVIPPEEERYALLTAGCGRDALSIK